MRNDTPGAARPATRLDYGRRIARAMALIAADPSHSPSLEELASAAAFTRAFRAAYGAPPAAYREAGGIGLPRPSPRNQEETAMPEITIRNEPALRVVALEHRGSYLKIGTAFDRVMAWGASRGLIGPETRFLGLYRDDPSAVPEKDLRSEACMSVPDGVEASDGLRILDLPPARVAVLVFKGPYAELEGAYRQLYRDWLPASGEEPADEPCREEYLNDCRTLPPSEWLTAIMLPLKG